MTALTVLEIELIGTVIAGLIFIGLYMRESTRSGLWDQHPGVRGAARHIVAVTLVAITEAGTLALLGLGVRIPIPVVLAGYGAGFLVVVHRIYLILRADRRDAMGFRKWLKRDALNRAWRTVLQFVAAVIVVPAGDAIIQVVQRAVIDSMAGKPMDWGQVAASARWGAVYGVTVALLAYLHRAKLDPSPIPSAQPTAPPPFLTPDAMAMKEPPK